MRRAAPAHPASEPAELQIRVVPAITDVPAASWDACANPLEAAAVSRDGSGPSATDFQSGCEEPPQKSRAASLETAGPGYNPFVSHDFLSSLERSGSATAKTGWQPQHLVAETSDGGVVGVVPCYLKSHSRGEYVFDRGWAEAYERAGGAYYPKLQVSVPFTPATGRRLLAAPGPRSHEVEAALAQGLVELARLREASSAHVTFMPEREWQALAERGFLQRTDQQFHWENAGYATFDDFLGALAARKRKVLKRERRDALQIGITVDWLTGADLTEAAWDDFFGFYMDTGSRKWGRPYLTREFFSLVGERMADRILLVMAK